MPTPQRQAIALLFACTFALPGCASMGERYRESPKAVLGTVLGAAAGAGVVAIAGGSEGSMVAAAIGGALLGGYIGNRLDQRDREMARAAAQRAFESSPSGSSVAWQNPDSGNRGSVTPTRTYQLADGQYCRQYRQDIWVGEQKEQATGTACRGSDGTWKIQS